MAKHENLTSLFTGIADAIREKEGSTETIVADDFPERVKNLATNEGEDALVSTNLVTYTNDRVTEIATYAFSDRETVKEVSFANVTEIHTSAFANCVRLRKVICPKLQSISRMAFAAAGAGSSGRGLEITCRRCGFVGYATFLGARVERFYMYPSFYINGELQFMIETDAFADSDITHLVLASENGEMCTLYDSDDNDGSFYGTPIASGTGYIYVPRALVDRYKVAENWSTYASQFRALEDYTLDGTITGDLDESKI